MSDDCLKCKEPMAGKGRSKYGRICRPCVAEFILSGDESKIDALLRMEEGVATGTLDPISRESAQRRIRTSSCERCGGSTDYDSGTKQGGVWCDDCGKNTCRSCSRRVVVSFETTGGETLDCNADRFLCKTCRAARILGNWKVKYVVGEPGKETLQETEP